MFHRIGLEPQRTAPFLSRRYRYRRDRRVVRADTGMPESLGDLLERGERDIPVWTLDDRYQLVEGRMTHVFPSGEKDVYRLRLSSGAEIKASANQPTNCVRGPPRGI